MTPTTTPELQQERGLDKARLNYIAVKHATLMPESWSDSEGHIVHGWQVVVPSDSATYRGKTIREAIDAAMPA